VVELYWKVTIGYNPRRAARRARKARRVGLAGAELAALVVLVEACAGRLYAINLYNSHHI
jgi:hypothetical protein